MSSVMRPRCLVASCFHSFGFGAMANSTLFNANVFVLYLCFQNIGIPQYHVIVGNMLFLVVAVVVFIVVVAAAAAAAAGRGVGVCCVGVVAVKA